MLKKLLLHTIIILTIFLPCHAEEDTKPEPKEQPKNCTVSGILGYGSYVGPRAGLEVENKNILNWGHRGNVKGVFSLKSNYISSRYVIPRFGLDNLSAFGEVELLKRKEVSFTRNEIKGRTGLKYIIPKEGLSYGIGYEYNHLKARRLSLDKKYGLKTARVSAINAFIEKDRLNSIINPENGWRIHGRMELANRAIGGNSKYFKADIGGSFHKSLGSKLFLHTSVRHGVLTGFEDMANDLPINKRYFLGGGNTIRGYTHGEASPRDDQGNEVGSLSYALANIELEQKVFKKFSIFTFLDALGYTAMAEDYPFNQGLYSAGAGISWRTPIGPLRGSYGFNLNPRKDDPKGAFNFSLSYAF